MTFLNLALLGGLAALAIPIVIHLFHKRRFRVIDWGAMHLLESVLQHNHRRVKIEQFILLLVRCLIPIVLALLMARPLLTGLRQLIGDAPTSLVLVLDHSYSMGGVAAGRSNFDRAVTEARKVIANLRAGSEVQVVLMGGSGGLLFDTPSFDLEAVGQRIGDTGPSRGLASVPAALGKAAIALSQMHLANREILIVSDFQKATWGGDPAKITEALAPLRALEPAPGVTLLRVGVPVRDNIAATSLEFPQLAAGIGQKMSFRANFQNFGQADAPHLRVAFRVDGVERSSSLLDLKAGEQGQALFTATFDTAGSHVVEVWADADPLKADNGMLASVPVRGTISVLILDGAPSTEPLRGETDFLEVALEPFGGDDPALKDLIKTRTVHAERFRREDLQDARVVILANVARLDDGRRNDLQAFVRAGGGLLVFPGDKADAGWHGRSELFPMKLDALAGERGAAPAAIVTGRFEHPALEYFNDPANGNLSGARIEHWYRLKPRDEAAPDPSVAVLARLDNGDPLLVEKAMGDGKVILAAIPADADWTNLPARPFYVPLMQKLTVYLASTIAPPVNLGVGETIVAFVPEKLAGTEAAITRPDGTTAPAQIVKKEGRGVIEHGETEAPGLYVVQAGEEPPLNYVVTAARTESDLTLLDVSASDALAASLDAPIVDSFEKLRELDQMRRHGREIWKPLLWALLALVFLELWLEQRFGRRRKAA